MEIPKIKRFIDVRVPITTCNLHCRYCYIAQRGLFKAKPPVFTYSPETVKVALSEKRMGGTCLFNLCGGGETLLAPGIADYIRVLLENGHYVSVITNGTVTKVFEKISQFPPDLLKHLFFKFSYHYVQLKEKGWFDRFFHNIRTVRSAGCSFTLELTPDDETTAYIDDLKQRALNEVGALPHCTIARNEVDENGETPILTKMSDEEYYRIWGDALHSDMFDFKRKVYGHKRCEFCYAGIWSFCLNLGTGIMTPCYSDILTQNIFEDPEKPIRFFPMGYRCPQPHCYNAHAYLTLGVIPEIDDITYAQLRNRVCADGSEWLQPEVKTFFSRKLKENNVEYTATQKLAWRFSYGVLAGERFVRRGINFIRRRLGGGR